MIGKTGFYLDCRTQPNIFVISILHSYTNLPYRRVRAASVELHSRYFDVHTATLSVDTHFVGLRRFLHDRPIASGALGIALTALSMVVLVAVFGRRIMTHVVIFVYFSLAIMLQ